MDSNPPPRLRESSIDASDASDQNVKPAAASGRHPDGLVRVTEVGRENLHDVIRPHESYEGWYRFDPSATWTRREENAVVFKTDLYVLTWSCLMFFCLQLDRGNLGNALTDTFLQDLRINTNVINNGATIQIVSFLTVEIPVQLLTKRYGFKHVLPLLMMAWGMVSWAQAFITTKGQFYATRALLGATEGGFIPGLILFMTYFYTSRELSTRLAWIWVTFNLSKIISSLLAAGILGMRGTEGRPGWFWLFLIEGLLTTFIGFVSYLYLPDSPVRTTGVLWRKPWYTEREEVIMVNRLLRDDPAKGLTDLKQPARWADIKGAWMDKSMWGLYLVGLVAYVPAQPVQGYLSLIIRRLGFSVFDSNMLSAPASGLQIILMLILSRSSDYFNERGFHCLIGELWMAPLLATLLGLPPDTSVWSRYTVTTLLCGYPYFHPIVTAWVSENSFDVKKRSISAATYNVMLQIGAVVASQIYRANDIPYYYKGNAALLAISVFSMAVIVGQKFYLNKLNSKKLAAWNAMTRQEQAGYQNDQAAREKDGNKRFDMLYKT